MKPSRLEDHLQRMHPEHAAKYIEFFESRRDKDGNLKQGTINKLLKKGSQNTYDGLIASYGISLVIAKQDLPVERKHLYYWQLLLHCSK